MCYWKEQSEILIRSNSLVQTDSLGACSTADIACNLSKYLMVFLGPHGHSYISISAKLLVYIFYSIQIVEFLMMRNGFCSSMCTHHKMSV